MSSQYITEPPPTAVVLLHTTAGPITVSLFAGQTPLTCRSFLQHCLDGYYDNVLFHRVSSGFVIQTGDPTGTGEGGVNIYDDGDSNMERLDGAWARLLRKTDDEGQRIVLNDEIHSRLKFNRRGLVGMAKSEMGGYGSQFFITLGDCRQQLDGQCTMFGRVEGEGIYNVVKIAEAELIEGTERPMYPEKILRTEIVEMPKGDAWDAMRPRQRVAARTTDGAREKKAPAKKKKGGKALLSFGDEEGDGVGEVVVRPKKAKFNTNLIDSESASVANEAKSKVNDRSELPLATKTAAARSPPRSTTQKRSAGEELLKQSPEPKRRKPSFHDSTTQLPLRDPESPLWSPTPEKPTRRRSSATKTVSNLQAEIAALKTSMRRDGGPTTEASSSKKQSVLESLIPSTSTRGRKRPRPGDVNSKDDITSLKMLDAFRARLERSTKGVSNDVRAQRARDRDEKVIPAISTIASKPDTQVSTAQREERKGKGEEDEPLICDLHFIADCQSCFAHENGNGYYPSSTSNAFLGGDTDQAFADADADAQDFMSHALSFAKDRLGKDLTWKKKNEEELIVIDPRERERELGIKPGSKSKSKSNLTGGREWDRDRERR